MSSNKSNIKKILKEFVDPEGGLIDGDRNVTNDSEIETGPVQKPFNDTSDYEKGVSTTTDRASRYRQSIPWFAVYSSKSTNGNPIVTNESSKKNITKKEIEDRIKEVILNKSEEKADVLDKDYNSKVEKIIDGIKNIELTDTQLKTLKDIIQNKISNKDA